MSEGRYAYKDNTELAILAASGDDEACTELVLAGDVYNENTTLYAGWEKLPVCTDGTLNHKWGNWTVATDNEHEVRVCSKCKAEETRKIEKAD